MDARRGFPGSGHRSVTESISTDVVVTGVANVSATRRPIYETRRFLMSTVDWAEAVALAMGGQLRGCGGAQRSASTADTR